MRQRRRERGETVVLKCEEGDRDTSEVISNQRRLGGEDISAQLQLMLHAPLYIPVSLHNIRPLSIFKDTMKLCKFKPKNLHASWHVLQVLQLAMTWQMFLI